MHSEQHNAEEALREARAFNAALLEAVDALVVVLDREGRILHFNRACREATGYASEEVCGRPIWETLLLSDEAGVVRTVFEELRAGQVPNRHENYWRTKDGGRRLIAWSNTVVRDPDGCVKYVIGTGLDLTELRRAEMRKSVQYEVTQVLAQAATVDEALPELLRAVTNAIGCQVGEFWELDARTGKLGAAHFWHVPDKAAAAFVSRSRRFEVNRLDSLPRRVWEKVEAQWISDLAHSSDFARKREASRAGLRSALAFPVVLESHVFGVMVFLGRQTTAPDEDLLRLLATLGSDIGQFIERKRVHEALQQGEILKQGILNSLPAEIAVLDKEGIIIGTNEAWEGFAWENRTSSDSPASRACVGVNYLEVCRKAIVEAGDEAARAVTGIEAVLDRSVPGFLIEYPCHSPVAERWFLMSVNPLSRPSGGAVISQIDITERKRLEKEILEISEREQSRIGQDLHDGLCQHLAGIEFRLLGLKQQVEGQSHELAAETSEVARLVRHAIDQTRSLAHGLSPVMLDPAGLMNGLQGLAVSSEQMFRVSFAFNCPAPVFIHDNAVATHLYRIAQEAVHNAIRHGQAKSVIINLLETGDRLILAIKDDGVGFPANPGKHNGLGLHVMQYRARLVNGSLAVQRDPDGGTSVACSLFHGGSAPASERA